MQPAPLHIVHFHNGSGGGVLSVIRNLLLYRQHEAIQNQVIYTINQDTVKHFELPGLHGAVSEQVFYYSPRWNFYHTCKQLAKLLPDENAVVVAHDWLELGMVSNLGLQNPLVHVLHGDFDYYYELAIRHSHVVDAYICISPTIFKSLKQKLPSRQESIFYLKFPVPGMMPKQRLEASLRIIYFVKDLKDERKQFSTILEVANQLSDCAGDYFFTIAGGGINAKEFFERWPAPMKDRVRFAGLQTSEEMSQLLSEQDIFLLPSLSEGFPVALVEAMKSGVVPLVTNWHGAVEELVTQAVTGYYFKPGAASDYVLCIKHLRANQDLLERLSKNCISRANEFFDPVINTKLLEEVFIRVYDQEGKHKHAAKAYGSRLDKPWLPNWTTKLLRTLSPKNLQL